MKRHVVSHVGVHQLVQYEPSRVCLLLSQLDLGFVRGYLGINPTYNKKENEPRMWDDRKYSLLVLGRPTLTLRARVGRPRTNRSYLRSSHIFGWFSCSIYGIRNNYCIIVLSCRVHTYKHRMKTLLMVLVVVAVLTKVRMGCVSFDNLILATLQL